MKDWVEKLNAFLKFNEREIIENAGSISSKVAIELASEEYRKYNQNRLQEREEDDFDRFLKENELIK